MSEHAKPGNRAPSTRRDFLKRTAAVSFAAASSCGIARGAFAGATGTIKVGMIGCGGRCTGAAGQALRTGRDVKLVAMCDIFEGRLENSLKALFRSAGDSGSRGRTGGFRDQIDVPPERRFVGFDGYKNVIDCSDVLLIACASKFHPMYAEAAIRAGKHVFVEKPHGIDPVGVRHMEAVCKLAEEKRLSIVSGLHSRFHTGWQETIKRIHDGIIGRVTSIQAMFLRGPYRLVQRDPKLTETQYQFSNWYHFLWLSGDDVPQSLVHNMDRAEWILQEETPTWCFGLGGRSASFGEVFGDMFDHHTVVYEYPSGARVYAMCRTQVGCYNNSGDIVVGTKGTCNLARCEIKGRNGETLWKYAGPRCNPYQLEQDALFDSIRKGEPLNSGYHMAHSTMITVMGQIACYTGKRTEWNQVAKSDLQFGPPPEESNFETPPPTVPDKTGNYPLPKPGLTQLL